MSNLVNIHVDGVDIQVPAGTTVVDAAMRADIKIPVFCHHPKLEPVGMCRMCLVQIGTPMRDRATGELLREADGSAKIMWGRTLQTGCTVRVSEGMVVKTQTDEVAKAREDMLAFILSSHPLDCPICDKGGECPLQNLTMRHGDATSNFYFEDKIKLDKHVPLGELIYLDRERCIQCGRCTRFQAEIAGDPVIAFHNRGRSLEIVTLSDPGFDSIWSGNTTDICPVGALTTADFRFGARPWELIPVASISPHGPVGENITFSTRREAKQGGRTVIKRIMPRQNEWVNEIWIPDSVRFVHHFAEAAERLTTPLIRKNGRLQPADWDEALDLVAQKLTQHKATATGLAGDRLSNEDLFLFQKLFRKVLGNDNIDLADKRLAGGDVTAEVGIASGSNLGTLGKGDAIAVVATDLHATAPIWWLRVKQAVQRGATLVVLNARPTRLDRYATHSVRSAPAELPAVLRALPEADAAYAEALRNAANLVIFYGHEGLGYAETDAVARLLANFLIASGHIGRVNNGLIAVWPHNNTQGAWDMGVVNGWGPGYREVRKPGLSAEDVYYAGKAGALYLLGADPVGDGLLPSRDGIDFLVVQELFMTATAALADVVLPAQSWAERDGTYTSGERRVQRYYPAITRVGDARPDWQIIGQLIERLGGDKAPFAASVVFAKEVAKGVRPYKDMTYRTLGEVVTQFPLVGDDELYYGGTSYKNEAGIGQQWAAGSEAKGKAKPYSVPDTDAPRRRGLTLIYTPSSYNRGTLADHSALIQQRVPHPTIALHPRTADELGLADGAPAELRLPETAFGAVVAVDEELPEAVALLRGFAYRADLSAARIAPGQTVTA